MSTRDDTHAIALRAIRDLLGGARSLELQLAGVKVTCSVASLPPEDWPVALTELTEDQHGPWPAGVAVTCQWAGGSCRLVTGPFRWAGGGYAGSLCPRLRADPGRELVFVNVSRRIGEAGDDSRIKLPVRFHVAPRKANATPELAEALNDGLRDVLIESRTPILGTSRAELCEVAIPSGEVLPPPVQAFARLIHLALLKLDFVDRERTTARGARLVDLGRWLTADQLAAMASAQPAPASGDDAGGEGDEGEEGGPPAASAAPTRRYWAGGVTEPSRLAKFQAENYWRLGYKRSDPEPAAQRAWKLFVEIQVGDYFAIKGLGGPHDLVVHYVGEVTSILPDEGRLLLRPLDLPRYEGKTPRGKGAGNWQNALVPITRPDLVEMIFGPGLEHGPLAIPVDAFFADLPLNLILYGPPGTGKTYELTTALVPRFQRVPTPVDADAALAGDLAWWELIAIALDDLGGSAKVPAVGHHPLVRAKYAMSPMKAPLDSLLWGVLQGHAVEGSKTVRYAKRSGEPMFDKDQDSTWRLALPLPEHLREIAQRRKAPASAAPLKDYTFVTFHQAYGYEDFIEGIRPVVENAADEAGGMLGYTLEAGAFMKAVQAAIRLARYDGSLHDLCTLGREKRRALFANAPRYAVFIDEINRGNVARIFGELITLLEDDKRLGAEHEVIVQLAHGRRLFGVPPNLHVIGTIELRWLNPAIVDPNGPPEYHSNLAEGLPHHLTKGGGHHPGISGSPLPEPGDETHRPYAGFRCARTVAGPSPPVVQAPRQGSSRSPFASPATPRRVRPLARSQRRKRRRHDRHHRGVTVRRCLRAHARRARPWSACLSRARSHVAERRAGFATASSPSTSRTRRSSVGSAGSSNGWRRPRSHFRWICFAVDLGSRSPSSAHCGR